MSSFYFIVVNIEVSCWIWLLLTLEEYLTFSSTDGLSQIRKLLHNKEPLFGYKRNVCLCKKSAPFFFNLVSFLVIVYFFKGYAA